MKLALGAQARQNTQVKAAAFPAVPMLPSTSPKISQSIYQVIGTFPNDYPPPAGRCEINRML